MAQLSRLRGWLTELRLVRVVTHYLQSDGNLLAAGMSYQAVFAVFAALWLGFSLTGAWLSSNPVVLDALTDIVNRIVPGLIGTIVPRSALNAASDDFGWISIIAAVGLLWTAIGWLYYTRQAVRIILDLPRDARSFLLQKAWDLLLALIFGVLLIVAALVSAASTQTLDWLFSTVDVPDHSLWASIVARAVSALIVLVLNTFTLGVMFRVLAHASIPWRPLLAGSIFGSIALTILNTLGGLVLGHTGSNPLLAPFAVFASLLIWLGLACRIILIAAAWIAVADDDLGRGRKVLVLRVFQRKHPQG